MNKKELVAKVRQEVSAVNMENIDAVLCAAFDAIKEEVASGGHFRLNGFGTFECVERAARKGRNPKTNEEMVIPPTKICKFTPSADFKEAVAK